MNVIFAAIFMTDGHFPSSLAEVSTTPLLSQTAELARHPAAALYDVMFGTALPVVTVIAARKNIPLTPDEHAPVLSYALKHISRVTMRRVKKGNADAVLTVQLAINHSLDVLAAMRMLGAFEALQDSPMTDKATLFARAEIAMKKSFANDKNPTLTVWPNLAAIVNEYHKRVTDTTSQSIPILSRSTGPRVTITPRAELWNNVIRAATPAWEELIHE